MVSEEDRRLCGKERCCQLDVCGPFQVHVCMCLVAQFAYNVISVLSAVTSSEGLVFVYCTMLRPPCEEKGWGTEGQSTVHPTDCEHSHLLKGGWGGWGAFSLTPPWPELLIKHVPKEAALSPMHKGFPSFLIFYFYFL